MKPWYAISRVSLATLGDSTLKVGPVQRTGTTPSRLHDTISLLSGPMGGMGAVVGRPRVAMADSHWATLELSGPTGRLNLTLEYLSRPGSWWTNWLLPPSSRVSIVVSMPRPSKLFHRPSSWPSILT